MSEGISIPPRIRAVEASGLMTPEFFRALQSLVRNINFTPIGVMQMVGNSYSTSATSAPAKVVGTTTSSYLSAFDHSNGRLTYTGEISKVICIVATVTFQSHNNDKVGVGISINGSFTMQYAHSNTTAVGITVQVVSELFKGDYVEVVVTNESNRPVTVTDLYVVAQ